MAMPHMAIGGGKKRQLGSLKPSVKKAVKALGKMGVPVGMRGMGMSKKMSKGHKKSGRKC